MSTYVISDLHGCFDEFKKILELIKFNNKDTLYILGDVFDRGSDPLSIIDFIRSKDNIILLRGNHEQMYLESRVTKDNRLWFRNGGLITYEAIAERGMEYEENLYKFISTLPCILVINNFILVHAGLYFPKNYEKLTIDELLELQEDEILLWSRDNIYNDIRYKDYFVICGHTPVHYINKRNESKITKVHGHIYIDCGCVFKSYGGKLGCLRLDDFKEFYV